MAKKPEPEEEQEEQEETAKEVYEKYSKGAEHLTIIGTGVAAPTEPPAPYDNDDNENLDHPKQK